jgi:hypothetical protein
VRKKRRFPSRSKRKDNKEKVKLLVVGVLIETATAREDDESNFSIT